MPSRCSNRVPCAVACWPARRSKSCDEVDMIFGSPAGGYSAKVTIELFMAGQRFSVGQIGRGILIFDKPVVLPATEGELVLTVDGQPRRWSIAIRNGGQPARIIEADF